MSMNQDQLQFYPTQESPHTGSKVVIDPSTPLIGSGHSSEGSLYAIQPRSNPSSEPAEPVGLKASGSFAESHSDPGDDSFEARRQR